MKICLAKRRHRWLLVAALVSTFQCLYAQDVYEPPFEVELVDVSFPELPGLHSFSLAEHDGLWLLIGGRINGLHGFTFNPFPPVFANRDVWVIDPVGQQVWSASLNALPDTLADPLRATNPQHVQIEDRLYIIGGYGDDSETSDQLTFPTLTAVEVPGLIQAVMDGTDLQPHLRRIQDDRLKVTGGDLKRLQDRLYLIFGHLFDGFYRRDAQTFVQEYTQQIRSFRILDDGVNLSLTDYEVQTDTAEFHRRDLTVSPVIFPDESFGLGAYGGVFQKDEDLPFLNPIYIDPDSAVVDTLFEQKMSHYTCPTLPLFERETGTMHTVFFGGIGQYYVDDATGELVRDDMVPFIDEITALTRFADGRSIETVLPVRMPGLLGSNAVFVPTGPVARYGNEVVKLDSLVDRQLVGHIYGGILANRPNLTPSSASDQLFEVYLSRPSTTALEGNPSAPVTLHLSIPYPNPFMRETRIQVTARRSERVRLEVFDGIGRRVGLLYEGILLAGRSYPFTIEADAWPAGVYWIRLTGEQAQHSRPMVLID